jgi:CxxC motif-containing protein (DUF1111 family)
MSLSARTPFAFVLLLVFVAFLSDDVQSQSRGFTAQDPGVRIGGNGAGGMLQGLTSIQQQAFNAGRLVIQEVASVQGTLPDTESGLGPRFNLDSCAGCHAQPDVGGTSPALNPQIAVAKKAGAINVIPPFITADGPVREARFKFNPDGTPDGGVHALFTITGRSDAGGCFLSQPDFQTAVATQNISFRIPTPAFGIGLIEAIDDTTILANLQANAATKQSLGIGGRPNRSGNDGTISRFGWKAQNKSLEIFSAEAYNVEQGVTSDLFPQERDGTNGCQFNATPESPTNWSSLNPIDVPSDVVKFAVFLRLLAPPTPSTDDPTTARGRKLFEDTGCASCHTPTLHTGKSSVGALQNQDANLFSDLSLHHMGPALADGISQGLAAGDEFRTAPLWGLGKRIFFLHDGRTKDLLAAIQAHASPGAGVFPPSEANQVVSNFNALNEMDKQVVLNFLRSL